MKGSALDGAGTKACVVCVLEEEGAQGVGRPDVLIF